MDVHLHARTHIHTLRCMLGRKLGWSLGSGYLRTPDAKPGAIYAPVYTCLCACARVCMRVSCVRVCTRVYACVCSCAQRVGSALCHRQSSEHRRILSLGRRRGTCTCVSSPMYVWPDISACLRVCLCSCVRLWMLYLCHSVTIATPMLDLAHVGSSAHAHHHCHHHAAAGR